MSERDETDGAGAAARRREYLAQRGEAAANLEQVTPEDHNRIVPHVQQMVVDWLRRYERIETRGESAND